MKRRASLTFFTFFAVGVLGCGAKTAVDDEPIERPEVVPSPEVCDGVDNDLDAEVDEPWLDDVGRYVHEDHCGACDQPCRPDAPEVLAVQCRLVEGRPLCAATVCAEGFVPATTGGCVPLIEILCLPCDDDGDCGVATGARCEDVGEERRCVAACQDGACPAGYACLDGECRPVGGSCWCEPGTGTFDVACTVEGVDPEGEPIECLGFARCVDGDLGACTSYAEVCDGLDNDCNGEIDEPYRDELGAYIDIHNCGACGVDCTASPLPAGDLTCGGDPFLPHCVLLCEDTLDGLDPGDRVDADLVFANGCECTISAVDDEPGPVRAEGEALDVNCDGADGNVRESIYVAPDGDDELPGSPSYPMRTISAALERAAASLETDAPRPYVFVAAGSYGEVLRVPEGVELHGGYRRDFLALDPDAYQSVVYASVGEESPGGAVVVIEDADERTVVRGLILHGASVSEESAAAYGVVVADSTSAVRLVDLVLYAGHGAAGRHGVDGEVGAGPTAEAGAGDLPRAAEENASHDCVDGAANRVAGGAGGVNVCDGVDVSGGDGGSARCPYFSEVQPEGDPGRGAGGGSGGRGGVDSQGPIVDSVGCLLPICCGLADFTVPSNMAYAGDGANGEPGTPGDAGRGCERPEGTFAGVVWTGAAATAGGTGRPGGGGGGGGAGGGAEMNWYDVDCEYADGLGGGGGGGGAGGCGGHGGTPGTSGGPSIGVLITYEEPSGRVDTPILEDLTIFVGDGGDGGRGGAGGDGGTGGNGGAGGSLPHAERINPSLAGPTPGAYGGQGGEGGPGGGGGGGCGGLSIGVLVSLDGAFTLRPGLESEYREACSVTLGQPGAGGEGGGGARAGGNGDDGYADAVLLL